jgi:O-antigen/teichoic acid export membrane protein
MRGWLDKRNFRFIAHGSLGRRMARSSFWSFISTIITRSLGLIVSIVIARLLGQVGYGHLGIIISTVGALNAVGNIGLGLTATRYVANLRNTNPQAAGRTAGSALLLATISYSLCSIALFIFASFVAEKMLNAPFLVGELRLASIILMLNGVDGVQQGILAGLEAFSVIARVTFIRGAVNLPITVLAAWHFGLNGVVAAMVIIALFSAWINNRAIQKLSDEAQIPMTYKIDKQQIKLLWNFSLPSFLVGILGVPSVWIVNALLVNQPKGYQEMALLTVATQWGAVANLVPSVLSKVGVSIQSNLLGEGDQNNFRRMVFYNLLFQLGGMILMVFLIVILSPWIMRSYGQAFSTGVSVLIFMSISWIFMAVGSVFWDAMASTGKIWWGFAFKFFSMLLFVFFSWKFIYMGASGIAIAYIISYASFAGLQSLYYMSYKKVPLPQNLWVEGGKN